MYLVFSLNIPCVLIPPMNCIVQLRTLRESGLAQQGCKCTGSHFQSLTREKKTSRTSLLNNSAKNNINGDIILSSSQLDTPGARSPSLFILEASLLVSAISLDAKPDSCKMHFLFCQPGMPKCDRKKGRIRRRRKKQSRLPERLVRDRASHAMSDGRPRTFGMRSMVVRDLRTIGFFWTGEMCVQLATMQPILLKGDL